MVEWLWHLITISPEFKHEGGGGWWWHFYQKFNKMSHLSQPTPDKMFVIKLPDNLLVCLSLITTIKSYRGLSIKILPPCGWYLLGPVSSDEDVLVDETEGWLVDGAVVLIQVVVSADHRQTVLWSWLVGRQAHLIRAVVRNILQLWGQEKWYRSLVVHNLCCVPTLVDIIIWLCTEQVCRKMFCLWRDVVS